eukprot:symbB.v1.2.009601.t1/scaffold613.1/size180894/9
MALSVCSRVRPALGLRLAPSLAQATLGSRNLHFSRAARCKEWSIDELINCNEEWRQKMKQTDPGFFDRTATTQKPRYLWIGCSDSRVAPGTICGLPPGTVFVHRNIANLVNNVDTSAMSVIQYAVGILKVQHIVLCGHYDCGGINAAVRNDDHPSPLANWLRNIRDVYRMHKEELSAIQDQDVRARRLVEINVIEQAINLYKTRIVQQRRIETYQNLEEYGFVQPKIHPCVYDPATGKLVRLDVEMQDYLDELKEIYNLYSVANLDDEDAAGWEGMGPSVVLPP